MTRGSVKFQQVAPGHGLIFRVTADHSPARWPEALKEEPLRERTPKFGSDVIWTVTSAYRNLGLDGAAKSFRTFYPIVDMDAAKIIVTRFIITDNQHTIENSGGRSPNFSRYIRKRRIQFSQ